MSQDPSAHLGPVITDDPYVRPRPSYIKADDLGLQNDTTTVRLDNKIFKSFEQSYSFKDVEVHAILPWNKTADGAVVPIKLNTLALISFSTHRDTFPVTSLGGFGIKGYTKGQGISSGAIGFIRGKVNGWEDVIRSLADYLDRPLNVASFSPDQIPPFDILMSVVNELGYVVTYIFRGVTIVSAMTSVSTEDIGSAEMYSYICKQILVQRSGN